eukprot:scaffold308365_cov13-Tisochrysis_lutea.AAC.1
MKPDIAGKCRKYYQTTGRIGYLATHPLRSPACFLTGNYTKFIIDRNGQAVKRLKPSFDPLGSESDVRLLLVSCRKQTVKSIVPQRKSVVFVVRQLVVVNRKSNAGNQSNWNFRWSFGLFEAVRASTALCSSLNATH